jgi:tetratricopeptide (TPR) repeat protein
MIRFYGYRQRLSTNAHWELEGSLEAAVKRDPAHSEIWACLSQIYLDEFSFKGRAEALDQALDAARKAIDLDRTNQLGFQVFAQAQFLRRDLAAFKPAAERAMALNPRDTNTLASMGIMIAHAGDFERGAELTRHAMELNPNHADWYQFGVIWQHFHAGEYEEALESALRVNMPGLFWQPLAVAAICGHLGRRDQAAAALRDLLAIDPGFPEHSRRIIEAWHYASGLTEPLLDGLRKAGLRIPEG